MTLSRCIGNASNKRRSRCITWLVAFTLALSIGSGVQAQLQWAGSVGSSITDVVTGVDTDSLGNVYISGAFTGTADFDPGPGVASVTSNGAYDSFLLKLDAQGQFVWVRNFGSTTNEPAASMDVDAAGNVVLAGWYSTSTDFDPGPGTAIPPFLGNTDAPDGFIVTFDSDGIFQWVYTLNSPDFVSALAAFDSNGDVVVTGFFNETLDFDSGPGDASVTCAASFEGFIMKLDADGNYLWTATAPSTVHSRGFRIATDSNNNIIVVGESVGDVDADPGPGTAPVNGYGVIDIFIWKLDTDGNYIWGGAVGGTLLDYGRALAIDQADNIIVAGSIEGTADMDPGPGITNFTSTGHYDAFVLKLEPNGDFLWAVRAGDLNEDRVEELVIAPDGSIWALGAFTGTVDFNPGPGADSLTSLGTYNGFAWNLDSDGTHLSTGGFLGPDTVEAWRGTMHPDDGLLVVGNFRQNMDAAPGPVSSVLTSAGDIDAFIVRFGESLVSMPLRAWPLIAAVSIAIAVVAWHRRRVQRAMPQDR
jgi:hypothetical protein